MCIRDEAKRAFLQAVDWLKYVELGGAVVVTLALGVVLGELTADSLERVQSITAIIATGTSISLAFAVLYFTQFDRRKSRNTMILAVLAFTTVANSISLFGYLNDTIHGIMFSLASTATVLFLTVGAVQGRFHSDIRKGGPHDRNQCRPSS